MTNIRIKQIINWWFNANWFNYCWVPGSVCLYAKLCHDDFLVFLMRFSMIPWRRWSKLCDTLLLWKTNKTNRNSFMDRYSSQKNATAENKHDMIERETTTTAKWKFQRKKKSNTHTYTSNQIFVPFATDRFKYIQSLKAVYAFFFRLRWVAGVACFSSFSITIPDMLSLFLLCTHFVRKLDEHNIEEKTRLFLFLFKNRQKAYWERKKTEYTYAASYVRASTTCPPINPFNFVNLTKIFEQH